jgi:hypothetical protein
MVLRGHPLTCTARKTVSALRGKSAPPSLEFSEKEIKISKRFWNVEVARETPLVGGERSAKPLKYQKVDSGRL